jgi:hypothetical protein
MEKYFKFLKNPHNYSCACSDNKTVANGAAHAGSEAGNKFKFDSYGDRASICHTPARAPARPHRINHGLKEGRDAGAVHTARPDGTDPSALRGGGPARPLA